MEMNGQLHRVMVSLLMLLILMGQVSTQFRSPNSNRGSCRRCRATSQPCRLHAVLHVPNSTVPYVIETPKCTCPRSSPSCSEDWDSNSDKKVVQELRTVGNNNINITLSMMFCAPVLPQRFCRREEVALQVSGFSNLPTVVEPINCRCPDEGHLVIYETSTDDRFIKLSSYICASHQRVCPTRRGRERFCLIEHRAAGYKTYPCRCPSGFSCVYFTTPRRGDPHFRCRRPHNRKRENN